MSGLAAKEGWLLIDHRASPGTREVPEGKVFESAAYVCGHCQYIVIKHKLRTRDRAVCLRCMDIICDGCAKIGECRPFWAQILDKPNTIISTPNTPARSTDNIFLPNATIYRGG